MEVNCPKCRAEIALEDINVAKDIALCRQFMLAVLRRMAGGRHAPELRRNAE